MPLPKLQVTLKSGEEKLLLNDNKIPFSLLDFWRWSASDILSNATRGRFAEFVVATATNVDIQEVRDVWGAFDLITSDGIKIGYEGSQQSISLKSLKNLTAPVTYESLNEKIKFKYEEVGK